MPLWMRRSACRERDLTSVTLSGRGEGLECSVHAVSGWEGFEKLVKYLVKHHGAILVQQHDGPDARRALLHIRGKAIEVQFEDPWGNSIISPSSASNEVLSGIAADLQARLA